MSIGNNKSMESNNVKHTVIGIVTTMKHKNSVGDKKTMRHKGIGDCGIKLLWIFLVLNIHILFIGNILHLIKIYICNNNEL
jgi:hypothetical protein